MHKLYDMYSGAETQFCEMCLSVYCGEVNKLCYKLGERYHLALSRLTFLEQPIFIYFKGNVIVLLVPK